MSRKVKKVFGLVVRVGLGFIICFLSTSSQVFATLTNSYPGAAIDNCGQLFGFYESPSWTNYFKVDYANEQQPVSVAITRDGTNWIMDSWGRVIKVGIGLENFDCPAFDFGPETDYEDIAVNYNGSVIYALRRDGTVKKAEPTGWLGFCGCGFTIYTCSTSPNISTYRNSPDTSKLWYGITIGNDGKIYTVDETGRVYNATDGIWVVSFGPTDKYGKVRSLAVWYDFYTNLYTVYVFDEGAIYNRYVSGGGWTKKFDIGECWGCYGSDIEISRDGQYLYFLDSGGRIYKQYEFSNTAPTPSTDINECIGRPVDSFATYRNLAPTATPTSPKDNNWVNTRYPRLTWNFSDIDGDTQYGRGVQVNNANNGGGTTIISSWDFSATNNYYDVTQSLSDGNYSWRVMVKDSADGYAWGPYSSWANFRVDATAPTTPGTPYLSSGSNPNNTGTYTISWTASTDSGGSGLQGYDVYRNGSYLTNVTTNSYSEFNISQGSYTYYVKAKDNAGNTSSSSGTSVAIVVDKTAPSSSVYDPPSTGKVTNSTTFEVKWSGSDSGGSGLAGWNIQYKDGPTGSWTDLKSKTGNPPVMFSASQTSTNFTGEVGHTYYFQLQGCDNAGNCENYPGGNGDGWVRINTPPTLSWTGEANYLTDGLNPETGNSSTDFTYRVKYIDADNDAPASGYPKVHILKAGTEIGIYSMTAADSNPFNTGRKYTYTINGLIDGSYTYYFEAKDSYQASADGEPTSEKSGPIVDGILPTVTSKTPIGINVPINSVITITFSEGMNQTSVENAFSITPSVTGSFSWSGNILTFTPSSNLSYSTTYTVKVTGAATDLAGNGLDGNNNGVSEGTPTDDYSWDFTTASGPISSTARIEIDHTYRGDLIVKVGVGEPSNPLWLKVVSNHEGGSADNIYETVDVTEASVYLPPSQTNKWFLYVIDEWCADIGEIKTFKITHNGIDYIATDTPVSIPDCNGAVYSYIPSTINNPPTLIWTGEAGYETDGLEPETGDTSTSFVYKIKYKDIDNDAPNFVKVHIKKGGNEIIGSPFSMSCIGTDYVNGIICSWTTQLSSGGNDYTYYFEAQDNKGASATPTTEIDAPDVTVPPDQWIATGFWHEIDDSLAPSGHTSSTPKTWWYGQDSTGNYDNGQANSGDLVSPLYNIVADSQLTFWSWEQTEDTGITWDKREIYISEDNGTNWTKIKQLTTPQNEWHQVNIDLASYVGKTVKFKFRFDTVDAYFNNFKGWYIDDIVVTGDNVPPEVVRANSIDNTTVDILFNESLDSTTANNSANYSIDNELTVSNAELQTDTKTVRLTTSSQTAGVNYTITVTNVKDVAGNIIQPPKNTAQFTGKGVNISKIVFVSTEQTVKAGDTSGIITIQTQDNVGNPIDVSSDTTINLTTTSSTGKFSLDFTNWVDITSVTIQSGKNTANFFYKDTKTGNYTLTASETPDAGWTDGTHPINIIPGNLDHFVFDTITSPQKTDSAFGIKITAYDKYDNSKTDFTEIANLQDTTGTISPTRTDNFTNGIWEGNVTITTMATQNKIKAIYGGIESVSNSFDVDDATLPTISDWIKSPEDLTEDSTGAFRIQVTVKDSGGSGLSGAPQLKYKRGSADANYTNYVDMTNLSDDTWYFDIPEPTEGWDSIKGQNVLYIVRASDNAGNIAESSEQSELVDSINDAPVLAAIGDKTVEEGQLLEFTISAADEDGDTLTYSAENLPEGAAFDENTQVFSWIPGYGQAGSYQVTFKVSDGSLDDTETITITVNNTPAFTPTAGLSMFSIPYIPKFTDPSSLGITKLARWDTVNSRYVYYSQDPANEILQLECGRGYWIKLDTQQKISVEISGKATVSADGYYHIPLKKGWNMIGNPFDYNVKFSDCRVKQGNVIKTLSEADDAGWLSNYAWAYKNAEVGFQLVHSTLSQYLGKNVLKNLEPWYGYAVYAQENCELLVDDKKASTKEKEDTIPISENNWNIQIIAKAKDAVDSAFCGVSPEVAKYKIPKLTPPSPCVKVLLEKGAIDFKEKMEKDRIEFEFTVETDILNTDITINLDTGNLPEGYRVKLVDMTSEKSVSTLTYTYNSGNSNTRKFRVIVEKPLVDITQDKELNLEYTYPYPNPYSGKAGAGSSAKKKYQADAITFRYRASGNIQKVTIEIYNIKGKLIDRFYDYTIDGEATYSFADRLANGVYIYRITITDGKNKISKTGKIVILK